MEIRVWSAKFSLLWREVFDFMQVFLLMHALPEKQVIFFPEYGNNPPFMRTAGAAQWSGGSQLSDSGTRPSRTSHHLLCGMAEIVSQ